MAPQFVGETARAREDSPTGERPSPVRLVIAFHPRLARVGEWFELPVDQAVAVHRLEPVFRDGPLDDPFVSRSGFWIKLSASGAVELFNHDNADIRIAGARVRGAQRIALGTDLVIGDRVVLRVDDDAEPCTDDLGLAGWSGAMRRVRASIGFAASRQGADGPVLVRGETGTGKELVARALHASSPRASGPFVAVNLAAIPSAVAAAELFGHDKGAFTGATESRRGYFERAAGGVLFLDEVGELAAEIQPMLLRAVDTGEIQPVGAAATRRSDARIVAATDADLEAMVARGTFRPALFHRLCATTVQLPALRDRGFDVALLFARFAGDRDHLVDATPWLSGTLAAELFRARLPGNVRQLRALVHRAVALQRVSRDDLEAIIGPAEVVDELSARAGEPPDVPIDDARLRDVLRRQRFQLGAAARALGISRTHLDALIAKSPTLRKAKDLTRDEIETSRRATGGDLDVMAEKLEVSARGLRLRMTQLGLD